MIVYFSGTGNSAYVAKRLQRELQDEGFDLFSSIRQRKKDTLYAKQPWVIVAPTYAWRIPRVVQEWLKAVELTGSRELYFVMTCGGSIGNAGAYLERLCKEKGLSLIHILSPFQAMPASKRAAYPYATCFVLQYIRQYPYMPS